MKFGSIWSYLEQQAGSVRVDLTHLIIHELQGQSWLPHAAAAHHDHLVQDQRTLGLALICCHDFSVPEEEAELDCKHAQVWWKKNRI